VAVDNDWLLLGSLPALEEEVQAVKYSEPGGNDQLAIFKEQRAVRYLEEELASYEGDGAKIELNADSVELYGGGGCLLGVY
jgi:hypothetical protein